MTWLLTSLRFNIQSPDCTGQTLSTFISLIPHLVVHPCPNPLFSCHIIPLALLMTSLWFVFGPEALCLLPFMLILLIKLSESWRGPCFLPTGVTQGWSSIGQWGEWLQATSKGWGAICCQHLKIIGLAKNLFGLFCNILMNDLANSVHPTRDGWHVWHYFV